MNGYVNVPDDQLLHGNPVLSKTGKKKWIRCTLFSSISYVYHTCIPARSRILGNSGGSCQKAKGIYKLQFWKWGRKVCGWGRVLKECCLFLGGYRVEGSEEGPRRYFRSVHASQSRLTTSCPAAAIHGQDKSRQPSRTDREVTASSKLCQLQTWAPAFSPHVQPSWQGFCLASTLHVGPC